MAVKFPQALSARRRIERVTQLGNAYERQRLGGITQADASPQFQLWQCFYVHTAVFGCQ
ncbi:TPA: hypothetical protein QEM39_000795 [Pseudomonas putida]|uniref:hypothetical protein n=1 Tax=Pseudomonas putida TaxID=303 RepID=UPI00236353F6|nr:hypothetical protein [Pseudomonas putida]MDD2152461.1 hypothetical protein [Pseudomonas putida]HDS1679313.1 hypothetical protein [Pseudomonas putida]